MAHRAVVSHVHMPHVPCRGEVGGAKHSTFFSADPVREEHGVGGDAHI